MSLIARLTEQSQNNLLLEELESMRRQLASGAGGGDRPKMNILFVGSNNDGSPDEAGKEIEARIERGESYEDLVIDSSVIEAEEAAAKAEAEAKAIEKRKPKALTLGND